MAKKKPVMLQMVIRKVTDLIPNLANTKTHPDEQVDEICASIKACGFCDPIGIDGKNLIIEGHGRLLAAQKLGMDEVPCVDLSHLTDKQKRIYALAHNKIPEHSRWDMKLLNQALNDLDAQPIDLTVTGFDLAELESIMTFDPEPQDDKATKEAKRICCPHCGRVFDPKKAGKNNA